MSFLHLRAAPKDIRRISASLFLTRGDSGRNLSAFWVLLVLAGVIASAGVVADSTATVIGAMIVAPLMKPILGTGLALVLANRDQLIKSMSLALGGALAVIVVGYLFGLIIQLDVTADTNTQVGARVSPRLIDLIAAIATGLVGAFAILREDVSDTLPGVAIAISLVPPLAVVGLTMESGAYEQSFGALLLFGTNMAAIIATGMILMLIARVRDAAVQADEPVGFLHSHGMIAVVVALTVFAIPLGYGSHRVIQEQTTIIKVKPIATEWATNFGWQVYSIRVQGNTLMVTVFGLPPEADGNDLRARLDAIGLQDFNVTIQLFASVSRNFPAAVTEISLVESP
ncbi:MAG: DUF389 domain-containing protein [Pseudorhodobacter sp.]